MTIRLSAHWEKLAPPDAFPYLQNRSRPLLYHQLRTAEALRNAPLVVNSYATGTGKTRASLLHLFELEGQRRNVLFIAPTNALIRQHVEDIRRFVAEHQLSFRVVEVNAEQLRTLCGRPDMPDLRGGETLHRLIGNPLEFASHLGIPSGDTRPLPLIMVVNPDIFHYMLFFRYGHHDRRNLFERALAAFSYVVIDEFHYYDSRQLVSFLCFLSIWEQWGYFAEDRKVCLLSATPNAQLETYLTRLLGERWRHISPDNEPPESTELPTEQTLTELELEISAASLEEWVGAERARLTAWLNRGLDGAIISNSLARINLAYDLLADLDVCRITGPEPPEQRAAALDHQLLLATPVVDIGYNFERAKPRQNIDFVVCEGRYSDDLVQRLGRAGRVLGKPQHHHPSAAVALVSPEAATKLLSHDGATLNRREFRDLVNSISTLPPKHRLDDYIRVHGIAEAFYPIYKVGALLPPDERETEVDALYERIRSVFAPQSQPRARALSGFYRAFDAREQWIHAGKVERWQPNGWHRQALVKNLADWLSQLQSTAGKQILVSPRDAAAVLDRVLANPKQRAGLEEFIYSQYHLTRSLFAFRDSFSGPEAVLYDPDRLFSSQAYNRYDLLHLIAHYHLHVFSNRDEFVRLCGDSELEGDFYLRLQRRREVPLLIEFRLSREDTDQRQFERRFCRCPVALRGLDLAGRVRSGDPVPLPPGLIAAIHATYVPLLILPHLDHGAMIAALRGTPIIARRLVVSFADGSDAEYHAIAGTAVWHADAMLRGFFAQRRQQEACDAIII